MSASLARRIRRIGMMHSVVTQEKVGEQLVEDEGGTQSIQPILKKKIVRYFDPAITPDVKIILANQIRSEWRNRRRERKQRERAARA